MAVMIAALLLLPIVGALKQKTLLSPVDEAELQETEWFAKGNDGQSLALPPPPEPPHTLHGHNILLVGDSNDRNFFGFLCASYGAIVQFVRTATYNNQVFEFPVASQGRFCHIPRYSISVMQVFHFGALTTAPHARWHSQALERNVQFSSHFPKVNGTKAIISSDAFVGVWRSMVGSSLPQRPRILVAQSSLWDSTVARWFLARQNREFRTQQAELEEWGWKRTDRGANHSDLAAWDWTSHVESFLKALRTGFGLQKVYWRTNPNCPIDDDDFDFLNSVSASQANSVRNATSFGEGIWGVVELIDWRKHYRAGHRNECNGKHYQYSGYKAYLDTLWGTLRRSPPGAKRQQQRKTAPA